MCSDIMIFLAILFNQELDFAKKLSIQNILSEFLVTAFDLGGRCGEKREYLPEDLALEALKEQLITFQFHAIHNSRSGSWVHTVGDTI